MGKILKQEELNSIIGTKCGRLTVIEYLGHYAKEGSKNPLYWFKCKCDCGNFIKVSKDHLNPNSNRAIFSCGCALKKHGLSNHPVYNTYKSMIGRVHRPHPIYHRKYIENNIGICKEWDGHPETFIEWAMKNGWKKGLSLDRIDNLGDYTPDNCRFTDSIT